MTGPEKPADETRRIVHEALICAPLAAVWRAVTSRTLVAEWLGANDLVPEVGRRFGLEITGAAGETRIADGEVLDVEADRRLRFRLTERDERTQDEPMEIRSTVTIALIQTDAGVLGRLTHDGFERIPLNVPVMVWAVAQQRVLHIRRTPRLHRAAPPTIASCGFRRLAWAA